MKDVRPLATFLFLNAVVLNLVLVVLPWTPERKTVFNNTARFLTASAGTDSWGEMHVALDVARREPARPLYSEVFLRRHIRFPYAPPSLLLTAAVERLPVSAERFLNALSWLAVLATAAVVARLFRQSGGAGGGTLSISLLAAGFTLTFYPIVKGFTLGQIQTAINLLLAVALLQWVDGRTGAAGMLAALPCLVKPQYALVLLWGVVRREWRFSMAFAVTVLAATLASLLAFGVQDHVSYLWMLSYVSAHGESYAANHSVNGLLQRLLFNGENLGWREDTYPPFNAWVSAGTAAASAAFVLACLFWRTGGRARATAADFMLAILTCVLASPVAWEHHYGILLPCYAVLLPTLARRPVFGRLTLPGLAASYMVASNYWGFTRGLAATRMNVLQSYLLFAALFVLVCLYALRHQTSTQADPMCAALPGSTSSRAPATSPNELAAS
jgi:alpha-1,2-mannosyltransferase